MDVNILIRNLHTIANNIHKGVDQFRIEKLRNGQEIIIENSLPNRLLLSSLYSKKTHADHLYRYFNKCAQLAAGLERELFVKDHEVSDLFVAVQKYNQTITAFNQNKLISESAIANKIKLDFIENRKVPELNPSKVISVTEGIVRDDLKKDKPEIVVEKRMLCNHDIRRYPGDRIDHTSEASRIFTSTQAERLMSGIGQVVESVTGIFGYKPTAFQKYHYRNQNETDAQIYAARTIPLSLDTEPSSYWLGHASLLLNIPLRSENGKVANFNVITDPIEEDMLAGLYPRQTRFARAMEGMPAASVYILSHNHPDHYSLETIRKIFAQQPIMIVPKGDGERYSAIAKELGFSNANIHELDWWEKKEIQFEQNGERYKMQITATPARHWSGQGPCGGHESTFLGYVIQGNDGGDIYFAGDTARLNDDHLKKLSQNFNIRWNFQPGGPDEVRKDMESTHQASVDALWVHFKVMIPRIYHKGMQKEEFLKRARDLKTVFMHTMTFKLGNLHLSDTKDSVINVLNALTSYPKPIKGLKSYEKQVYDELCQMANEFSFADGKGFEPFEVARLLEETVIIPKIGSRLGLQTMKHSQWSNIFN